MKLTDITKNVKDIAAGLPIDVIVEAAAKTRSAEEAEAAIKGGIQILGYNYVQEAEKIKAHIDADVAWHLIGHLQKNKAKKAVQIFDMIETIDSVELAEIVDKLCGQMNKNMDVLIEVNSGRETRKAGVEPDAVESLLQHINSLSNIRVKGLMTMGPWVDDPELLRPFFKQTHELFNHIASLDIPNIEMRFLSMGMSGSYRVAIEEGANIVRLGTVLFGGRE
jgi:PLP dependent protein